MGEIYEWVRNIVIYLILNTIIMNLLGNSSYKKYVSIVSGMILLMIVISPFLKLLKMDEILDYYLSSNIYHTDAAEFRNELMLMEEKQKEVVILDFKERIGSQVKNLLLDEGLYLYDFEVIMNHDVESESYGEIISMKIDAGYLEEEGIPAHKINIEKIKIHNLEKVIADVENTKQSLPSPEEIHIKNKLSDFYNMKQDNINISIQGG